MVKKVNAIWTNDTNNLVKKADFNTNIEKIEKKKILINLHVQFDERLKEARLTTNNDLCTVQQHAIKNEGIIEKLQTLDSSYFKGKSSFEDVGTTNYLTIQSVFRYFTKIHNSNHISE